MRVHGLGWLGLALVVTAGCDPIYLIEPSDEVSGTLHEGVITTDETWRAADNPHRITGQLLVAGPSAPTLTIEPGVRVLFARGAGLTIGTRNEPGSLQAVGTASDEIEFMSTLQFQSHGYWGALQFSHAAGPSRLEHVTIQDCGRTADWPEACLRVIGTGDTGPVVRDVTIAFSSGYGFAGAGGGFGPDSRGLRVLSTRSAPVRIGPNQVGTLPTDLSFAEQGTVAIEVGGGRLFTSQAWPALDMPYVVVNTVTVSGEGTPTLELRPGTELLFGSAGEIVVGGENGSGKLTAWGTQSEPVVFSAVNPQPGSWNGVTFRANASRESLMIRTVVEYGGKANGYSKANITFFDDIGPVVRNSVIRHSDGCGVVQLPIAGEWTTDLTDPSLGNQFSDTAFAAQCTQQ